MPVASNYCACYGCENMDTHTHAGGGSNYAAIRDGFANRYWTSPFLDNPTVTAALGVLGPGDGRLHPVLFAPGITVNQVRFRAYFYSSPGTAPIVRVGLYSLDADTLKPTALLNETGDITISATGSLNTYTTAVSWDMTGYTWVGVAICHMDDPGDASRSAPETVTLELFGKTAAANSVNYGAYGLELSGSNWIQHQSLWCAASAPLSSMPAYTVWGASSTYGAFDSGVQVRNS